ncbi:mannose-binding protein C-like isoform 2-T2 [Discoglossus pictus]
MGSIGAPGTEGPTGPTGPKGSQGERGQIGDPGPKGSNGAPGTAGPTGPKGDQGERGITGENGAKGEKGDRNFERVQVIGTLEHRIASLEKQFSLLNNIVFFRMDAQTSFGNKMYILSWRQGNFATAQALCKKYGGTMPIPLNNEENAAIYSVIRIAKSMTRKDVFLGINDIKQEEVFVDDDGKKITYTNWANGEPGGKRAENCIQLNTDGTWADYTCETINQVVCEFIVS